MLCQHSDLRLRRLTVLCGSTQAALKGRAKEEERRGVSCGSFGRLKSILPSPPPHSQCRQQCLSSGLRTGLLFSDLCDYQPSSLLPLSLLPSLQPSFAVAAVTSLSLLVSCSPLHLLLSPPHPMQIPSIHLKACTAAGKQIPANSSASSSPVLRRGKKQRMRKWKGCVKSEK